MMPFLDPVAVTEEGDVVKARSEGGAASAPRAVAGAGVAGVRP
jgi:hypothetical protein